MLEPTVFTEVVVVDFTIATLGDCAAGMVTVFDGTGVRTVPDGVVARDAAVLTIEPVSRSDWVTVCVPVHVVEAPMASDVVAQLTPAVLGSATTSDVSATFPVFVTAKEYPIDEPAVA